MATNGLRRTLGRLVGFSWRLSFMWFASTVLVGAVGGMIVNALGKPQLAYSVGMVLGWALPIPIGIWAWISAVKAERRHEEKREAAKASASPAPT